MTVVQAKETPWLFGGMNIRLLFIDIMPFRGL